MALNFVNSKYISVHFLRTLAVTLTTVLLLMLPPYILVWPTNVSISMKRPVLNIEARKEVSRGGWNGHHHLFCHPSLLKVPDKHPGEGEDEGSSGGVGGDYGYGGGDSGVDGGGDNKDFSRACPPGFQNPKPTQISY